MMRILCILVLVLPLGACVPKLDPTGAKQNLKNWQRVSPDLVNAFDGKKLELSDVEKRGRKRALKQMMSLAEKMAETAEGN